MTDNNEHESVNESHGLSLELFEAAVKALVELRDSGKYMVFLGRQTSVKFVGELQEFQRALTEGLHREVSPDEAKKALREVRNFHKATVHFQRASQIVEFLERNIYDEEFGALDDEEKTRLRELLSAKGRLVSEHLYTGAMKQRSQRMETATAPCVEELDVELVKDRHDELRGSNVGQPFLRVRLRYSEATVAAHPYLIFGPPPWGGVGPFCLPSFEFECDESDIDLLIFRLTAAKNLLLESGDES